ncbi:MAG: N-acetyltransferase [Microthrixaceae bacterium]
MSDAKGDGHRALRYREATRADAEAIALLHAASWRHAYRGQFPDRYLDEEVEADRREVWRVRLDTPESTVTVVGEEGRSLVGFVHCVPDQHSTWGTLLDNIHVDPARTGEGIGRRLMAEAAGRLRPIAALPTLHLWVLAANTRAIGFYESLGGRPTGTSTSDQGGSNAPVIRYWWPDLAVLSGADC